MSLLPRVMIVNAKGPGGGGARQALQLAAGLRHEGFPVTFATRPDSAWERLTGEAGVDHVSFRFKNILDAATMLGLRRYCREKDVRILQVQKGTEFALSLPACIGRSRTNLVVYRGVSFPLDVWNGMKYRLRAVKRVVAVSEFVRRQIIEAGVCPERVVTIYGGVNPETFRTHPERLDGLRRELNLGEGPVVGMIAHLRSWKRHEDLLDAAARLVPDFPGLRLLCAGRINTEVHAALLSQAERLGITGAVRFIGEREDVPDLLGLCAASVNCADAGEGLTGALRESLLLKVPVVATRIAGNTEIIRDGETGLLVAPRDPQGLSGAIRRVLTDEPLRHRLVAAGYELASTRLTLEAQVRQYRDLYLRVLSESGE